MRSRKLQSANQERDSSNKFVGHALSTFRLGPLIDIVWVVVERLDELVQLSLLSVVMLLV